MSQQIGAYLFWNHRLSVFGPRVLQPDCGNTCEGEITSARVCWKLRWKLKSNSCGDMCVADHRSKVAAIDVTIARVYVRAPLWLINVGIAHYNRRVRSQLTMFVIGFARLRTIAKNHDGEKSALCIESADSIHARSRLSQRK